MTKPDITDRGFDIIDRGFDIIVNGTRYPVSNDEVTFDQVVDLAYPTGGRGPLIKYTVDFYDGAGRLPEGKLTEGQAVKVKDRTVFNVTRTDRS